MVSHLKNAVITTATVLAVLYVLRMTPAKQIVEKAYIG